jgi:hypothetical protein
MGMLQPEEAPLMYAALKDAPAIIFDQRVILPFHHPIPPNTRSNHPFTQSLFFRTFSKVSLCP